MSKIRNVIKYFSSMVVRLHIFLFYILVIGICSSYGYSWYNTHTILTNEDASKIATLVQKQQEVIQYLVDRKKCIAI